MTEISMTELYEKLDKLSSDELILDVRTPQEYYSGHVPGSKNIPHDEVAIHADELRQYKHVYIHCKMGGRACVAAEALSKLGLKNLIVVSKSGMGEWVASGFPVEK